MAQCGLYQETRDPPSDDPDDCPHHGPRLGAAAAVAGHRLGGHAAGCF